MSMINDQIAWSIGNDLAKLSKHANPNTPPLYLFMQQLETTIPTFARMGPEAQGDLIAEAQTGWQDFFGGTK